jgi:hypothetical protein
MSNPQFIMLLGALLFIGSASYDDQSAPVSETTFFLSLLLLVGGTIWWLV